MKEPKKMKKTVDGRNPKQPPGMYKTPNKSPINSGINFQPQQVNAGSINSMMWFRQTKTFVVKQHVLLVELG